MDTTMKICILGVGGTFMGSLAVLAKQLGYDVCGIDGTDLYPPMSEQLAQHQIQVLTGYDQIDLSALDVDMFVVGNVLSRGNPVIEQLLSLGLPFMSGPAWLSMYVLSSKKVIAVAGTHGKTTTASMIAWLLQQAGKKPSFLIGGVPNNFGVTAKWQAGEYFVIEADEYDTAFFDKRPKFMQYQPNQLVLLNVEYDHADIYPDLDAIIQQFHYGVRLVPSTGHVIYNQSCQNLQKVIKKGIWSKQITFGLTNGLWHAGEISAQFDAFTVYKGKQAIGRVEWDLLGAHNISNGLAALATIDSLGIDARFALEALSSFSSVKRRMTRLGQNRSLIAFEDFAHHPTAIATTLAGLKAKYPNKQLVAVLDLRSNTFKLGKHSPAHIVSALDDADQVYLYQHTDLDWDIASVVKLASDKIDLFSDLDALVPKLVSDDSNQKVLLLCSNGSFGGLAQKVTTAMAPNSATSKTSQTD